MIHIILLFLSFFPTNNVELTTSDPNTIAVEIEYGSGYYCTGRNRICSISESQAQEYSATLTLNNDGTYLLRIPILNKKISESNLPNLESIQLDKTTYLEFQESKTSIEIPTGEYSIKRSDKNYEILFD